MNRKDFKKQATHPLQSWEWGEFRKKMGNEVVRFNFGQITVHKLPFTNYKIGMFIKGIKPTQKMLDELTKFARENNIVFIKTEFNAEDNKLIELLRKNGAIAGKTLFTPTTFEIDLTKSEEDLLKSFSSKTRYNIKLAQKKGVKISEDNSNEAFEKYLELTRETVERQGFYAHSEKYHREMWSYLNSKPKAQNSKPIARLLVAKYKKEIITAWILFKWKDTLYYPYGAASLKHRNVMANNLMMWEAIRFGKKLKLKKFDLWGREPGKGFTKFKEGYNPKVVEFLGTWDLVINKPVYYLYRAVEVLRWMFLRTKSRFVKPRF